MPPRAASPGRRAPTAATEGVAAAALRLAGPLLRSSAQAAEAGASDAPSRVLHAALAVVYRLVAARAAARRSPDLARWEATLAPARVTWGDLAAAVGPEGPLAALGLDAADTGALPCDALAATLLAADGADADARAALAALAAVVGGDSDPLGLAATHQALLARTPGIVDGALTLAHSGAGRRAAGSFYTPPALVEWLLDATLAPALDAHADRRGPFSVLDPACGAGAFLVAAARRMRGRLEAPAHRVFGVDLDPLAVLACRLALFVETLPIAAPEHTAPALPERDALAPPERDALAPPERDALARHLRVAVRHGDALLGADDAFVAAGLPDLAWAPRPGVDRATLARWRTRGRAARARTPTDGAGASSAPERAASSAPDRAASSAPDRAASSAPHPGASSAADAWCAAFFWTPAHGDAPTDDTLRALRDGDAAAPAGVTALAHAHAFLHWPLAFPDARLRGGFDVVLGNPPFLNQLERGTVASRPAAALVRARFGDRVAAYTDTAALLLLQGARLVRPGGRLGMVAPQSVLSAAGARGIRDTLRELAPPTHLWWAGARAFPGASVLVAALALHRPAAPTTPTTPRPPLRRAHGLSFAPLPALPPTALDAAGESWAPLVADALGAPALHLRPAGHLGELARATADFRDEYYGLRPFVVDRPDADDTRFAPLVLTGHVDPARRRWGERPVRFAKEAWLAPRVDLEALRADGRLAGWARDRLVPKLLLATQTRVLEAVADPEGYWLTTTPTITVLPEAGALWRVAAVLLGPVATAWALTHHGTAALAVGALKLSARQVEAIPLPVDPVAWDAAADHVAAAHTDDAHRDAHLLAAARLTVRAYGADDALVAWWQARLPHDRAAHR